MVKYLAKYNLGDHVYLAELEQDGKQVLAIVHENDKGEIIRMRTFEKDGETE